MASHGKMLWLFGGLLARSCAYPKASIRRLREFYFLKIKKNEATPIATVARNNSNKLTSTEAGKFIFLSFAIIRNVELHTLIIKNPTPKMIFNLSGDKSMLFLMKNNWAPKKAIMKRTAISDNANINLFLLITTQMIF